MINLIQGILVSHQLVSMPHSLRIPLLHLIRKSGFYYGRHILCGLRYQRQESIADVSTSSQYDYSGYV